MSEEIQQYLPLIEGATGILLAVITWKLVTVTKELVKATEELKRGQEIAWEVRNTAEITVTLEQNRWAGLAAYDVVVTNTGLGPAEEVELKWKENPRTSPGIKLDADQKIPLEYIGGMRPGQTVECFAVHTLNKGVDLNKIYEVTAIWHDKAGGERKKQRKQRIRVPSGVTLLGDGDPLVKIADRLKELEKVRKSVEAGGMRRT